MVVPSTCTQPFVEEVASTQDTVPVVVIGPPVSPVPVATLVTVPDPPPPSDAAGVQYHPLVGRNVAKAGVDPPPVHVPAVDCASRT